VSSGLWAGFAHDRKAPGLSLGFQSLPVKAPLCISIVLLLFAVEIEFSQFIGKSQLLSIRLPE